MLIALALLSQAALALAQCQCEEYRKYYSSYTSTQPAYDYPYSSTGYSYNYGTYAQPMAYETSAVNAFVYPYSIPVVYEYPKEDTPCSCGRRTENNSPYESGWYDDEEREYCSSRCTCTSTELEPRYWEERDSKPKYGCKHSEDNRRGSGRYYDKENEYSECRCCKVKCICVCDESIDEFREDDWDRRNSRCDDRGCRRRESNPDCGCGCRNKKY